MSQEADQRRQENDALRREIAHLRQVDAERQATLVAQQQQLEICQEQIALLKKVIFAPRRERFIPSADRKLLFGPEPMDESSAAPPACETESDNPEAERPLAGGKPRRTSDGSGLNCRSVYPSGVSNIRCRPSNGPVAAVAAASAW